MNEFGQVESNPEDLQTLAALNAVFEMQIEDIVLDITQRFGADGKKAVQAVARCLLLDKNPPSNQASDALVSALNDMGMDHTDLRAVYPLTVATMRKDGLL